MFLALTRALAGPGGVDEGCTSSAQRGAALNITAWIARRNLWLVVLQAGLLTSERWFPWLEGPVGLPWIDHRVRTFPDRFRVVSSKQTRARWARRPSVTVAGAVPVSHRLPVSPRGGCSIPPWGTCRWLPRAS